MITKIKKKIEKWQQTRRKNQLEKTLVESFKQFEKDMWEELKKWNDSPQLLNAIRLGTSIRHICEMIGKKELFKSHFQLLNQVRTFDRAFASRIDALKRKHDYGNTEKFRVEQKKDFDVRYIISTLKNLIQEFKDTEHQRNNLQKPSKNNKNQPIYNKNTFKESINNFFEHSVIKFHSQAPIPQNLWDKVYKWGYYKLHPEDKLFNTKKIKAVKSQLSSENLQQLPSNLPPKVEKRIIKTVIKKFDRLLHHLETLGYYNHVHEWGNKWLHHSEHLANTQIEASDYQRESAIKVVKELRNYYRDLDNWLERVEVKYANPHNRNPNEPPVDNKLTLQILQYYEKLRSTYIERFQKRKILQGIREKEQKEAHAKRKKAKSEKRLRKKLEKEQLQDQKVNSTNPIKKIDKNKAKLKSEIDIEKVKKEKDKKV